MFGGFFVDGLKLTFKGDQLRALLDERVQRHLRLAESWKRDLARSPEQQTDEALLPVRLRVHEAQRHEWRAAVLQFLRDHVEPSEVYRLGEADLDFGELLPEKPDSLERDEFDARMGVAFELEQMTNEVRQPDPAELVIAASQPESDGR